MTGENQLRQYLLGDLSTEERTAFEDQYFVDVALFEELIATENDLIDSCVRGALRGSEKQKFESRYGTSPQGQARIQFAHAFSQVTQRLAHDATISIWSRLGEGWQHRGVLQWALATVAFAVALGFMWQNRLLRSELQYASVGQAELRREEDALRQQLAASGINKRGEQTIETAKLEPEVLLRLTPGAVRGANHQVELVISPTVLLVELQMVLDQDEYASYQAQLQTVEGMELLRANYLKSQAVGASKVLLWPVPTDSIQPNDYVVRLSGIRNGHVTKEIESYSFHVVRK
jgi:hypothetical protein